MQRTKVHSTANAALIQRILEDAKHAPLGSYEAYEAAKRKFNEQTRGFTLWEYDRFVAKLTKILKI